MKLTGPTPAQLMLPLKKTGIPFTLKPYEEILEVLEPDPDTVVLLIRCVTTKETRSGFQITATGSRLHIRTKGVVVGGDVAGWSEKILTSWDEESHPFYRTIGLSVTPKIYLDRLNWALDCYRPGSETNPLDNAERTYLHRDYSSPSMINHWDSGYRGSSTL